MAGNERLARKFYQGAQKVLRAEDKRQLLEGVYEARHQPWLEDAEEPAPDGLPEETGTPSDENRPR